MIQGAPAAAVVTLGSLSLHVAGRTSGMQMATMEGWSTSEAKSEIVDMPLTHGSWTNPIDRRASTAISITGWCTASTYSLLLDSREALQALGGKHTLSVTDDKRTTMRVVSVRRIQCDDDYGLGSFDWSLDLIADDPRRYSTVLKEVASGVAVANAGKAPTSPVLRVAGPVTDGFTVTDNTGRVVRFAGAVTAGETVVIDRAVGYAAVNGAASMGMRRFDWPLIPAGQNRTFTLTGGGTLTVQSRDAWW